MKTRSYILSILTGACVVVLPPMLLSASAQHRAMLQGLIPSVPLSLVRAASQPMAAPASIPALQDALSTAVPPALAPAVAPVPGIELAPLPSTELTVNLENVNTSERASFHIAPSGYVRASEAKALENFFRCRRTGKHKPIRPDTLVLLADIARKWPNRVIEVISGYRAPPFGAPHSRHFLGHAIDLRVRGVRTAKVRDYVWAQHQGVGVGHYSAGNFLHVDSRDEDTAWSAREETANANYRPRWAKRARRARALAAASAPVASLAVR
jgi:uncharacterized protein YcbK (DUF882 family)